MSPDSDSEQYNARLGLKLFVIYLVLYLGFVFINAFATQVMESKVLAGLNLAVVYGFALIIGALVMALIYGAMCKSEPSDSSSDGSSDSDAASNEGANE